MLEQANAKKGSHVIAAAIRAADIDTIFTVAGGHFLPTYNELGRLGSPDIVAARHELGAGYMASGYALSTGKVGVVFSGAPGPGATNLVTPVANAMADSIPLLILTAQVDRRYLNRNILQYCDNQALFRPITKKSVQAVSATEIPNLITTGLQIAQSGRPGPVHIDLPQSLQIDTVDFMADIKTVPLAPPEPSTTDIDVVVDAVQQSKRPAILAGHGVIRARATDALKDLAARLGAPVATSRSGIGCMPNADPNSVGMLGFYGTETAREAISSADLVLVIGCALGEQTTYGWNSDLFSGDANIIQADIDAIQPNLVYPVSRAVQTDAGRFIAALAERLAPQNPWYDRQPEPFAAANDPAAGMSAATVLQTLNGVLPSSAFVSADIGNHRLWVCDQLDVTHADRLLQSCEFDAMGFSLPAAIGASIGNPGANIVSISGDGGYVHTMGELAVAREHNLPIAAIVFVDGALGILRHQAEAMYGSDHFVRLAAIDFAKVAEGFGVASRHVANESELKDAIDWAIGSTEPVLLSVQIDPQEIFPPLRSKIEQRKRDLMGQKS